MIVKYLDLCDGHVVRGGVEPLDRVDHAGVVHLAKERCLINTLSLIKLSFKLPNISAHLISSSCCDVFHFTIYFWQPSTGLG